MSKTTAIFDAFFLQHLPRIHRRVRDAIELAIKEWIRADSEIDQSGLAAKAIPLIIDKYSHYDKEGPILSNDGLRTVSTIVDNINKFEGLITHVRTRFQRKIYRDHLNHMLRTALLASFIGRLARLDRNRCRRLVIAALFHDAGYPVQEAGEIMKIVSKAVGEGYSLLAFENLRSRLKGTMCCHVELPTATGIDFGILQQHVVGESVEHSVVGAFEFLACCEECSDAAIEIASAICLHSQNTVEEISFEDSPLAVCLVIADELQDWGRPVAHPDGSITIPMEELGSFFTARFSGTLECELEYNESEFPVLDIIYSKHINLKRLQLDNAPLRLRFEFPLTRFSRSIPCASYLIPPREAFPEFKIKRRAGSPWRLTMLTTELSFTDKEVAERTGTDEELVEAARKALMCLENRSPAALNDWILLRYGQSFNYLVTKEEKGPASFELVNYEGQFKLQLNPGRTSVHRPRERSLFGDLIFLNDPPPGTFIPRVLRPLPVILSLKSIITTGQPVNAFWFKAKSIAPRSSRKRRRLMRDIPDTVTKLFLEGLSPDFREMLEKTGDITDVGS